MIAALAPATHAAMQLAETTISSYELSKPENFKTIKDGCAELPLQEVLREKLVRYSAEAGLKDRVEMVFLLFFRSNFEYFFHY